MAATIPVLIVGAGPVGLGLAAELGRLGIACVVAEQTDGTIAHPRASELNARTMEFCRRWGIADAVRAALPAADIVNRGSEGADLNHAPMDISAARDVLGWQPKWPLEAGVRAYAEWLRSHEF